MELVEGETLQTRIQRGPIAISEALSIARQIAEALEAAHEKGVIHRDLKPGNIMLADGKVKVLDFGLAKAYDGPSANADLANSPTMVSMAGTSAGVILGTAAYMSPEQAKGRAVDRRTDIFAFGCVLYEMLTAKRAFDGEDVTDILGAVLRVEPDWSHLPDGVPAGVRRLLRLCLEKNPKNRRSDATDVRLDLEHVLSEPATAAGAPVEIRKRPLWARGAPVASALVLGGIVSGAAVWNLRSETDTGAPTRFAVTLPQDQTFSNTGRKFVAVSPDGSAMAYTANSRICRVSENGGKPELLVQAKDGETTHGPQVLPGGKAILYTARSAASSDWDKAQIGVVRIHTRPAFSFGEPLVFATAGLQSRNPAGAPRVWDIAPDRKRLIGVTDATESATSSDAATPQVEVVLNWFTDLQARVPK